MNKTVEYCKCYIQGYLEYEPRYQVVFKMLWFNNDHRHVTKVIAQNTKTLECSKRSDNYYNNRSLRFAAAFLYLFVI